MSGSLEEIWTTLALKYLPRNLKYLERSPVKFKSDVDVGSWAVWS